MDFGMLAEHYSAFSAIAAERTAQDRKWGEQNHAPLYWLGILSEETGEVAKELIEDGNAERIRSELVQVGAVVVAWLECLDRWPDEHARALAVREG